MTFELRIALVGLATFAAVGLLVAALVPAAARRLGAGPAVHRAARLARLRMLPTIAASLAAVLVSSAFLVFEPRWDGERVSLVVQALAASTILLAVATACRGVVLARRTRRLIDEWLRTAEPVVLPGISASAYAVTSDFPIVAVVGVTRPRLIIARSVLACCSDAELRAVLAHEQGHIDRRDNLQRLLITLAPDVLTWLPVSAAISAAWHDAAEEAADDEATNAGVDGRLRLASALVKVARLAPAASYQVGMPASALYRGEDLDRRVRRLLQPGMRAASTPRAGRLLAIGFALLAVASVTVLDGVHDVVEGLIHILP